LLPGGGGRVRGGWKVCGHLITAEESDEREVRGEGGEGGESDIFLRSRRSAKRKWEPR
jgi:hypothetical protein